jgi:outer membrane protein TolC
MTHRRRGPAVSPTASRTLAQAAAVGLAGSAALATLGGCVQDPMPFDPRLAQQWERRDDAETRSPHLYPLPTTPQPRFHAGAMTLQEVIHRAVANNLDIRVSGFDTAVDQTRILEAQANFDPTFFSDIGFQDVNKQSPGGDAVTVAKGANIFSNKTTLSNGAAVFNTFISRVDKEALTTFDAGFRQNLEAGGKISIQENVNNSWFFPTRSLLNPYYENDLVLQLSQPLLQNFGVAVNAARITIAQNTARVSLLDFRKTVEDTVLKIEQTYWELLQAERDVDTSRELVEESEQTAELLFRREAQGQEVTGSQVDQANADTAARRVDLEAALNRVGDLSDQLKRLMDDPAFPVASSTLISPADDFGRDPLQFNEDDQIETALENRLELGQQQVRISSSEVAVDVARNGLLPSLTLGLTGTVDGLDRTLSGTFNSQGNWNRLGYSAELQFQLPIGNRAARAVWQRALLQRMQAIASYGVEIEQVTTEVRAATRAVTFAWRRLVEARNSVLGYEKTLASLRAQVQSGDQPLTFDFVLNLLQDQERMANQQRAEHQAANDYNFAIAQLESAKGTILRYNNVIMEQEPLPFDLQLAGDPEPRPTPPGYPYPDHVRGPLAP